jgi:hypothetical protein
MLMERKNELEPYTIDYPTRVSDRNSKLGKMLNINLPPVVSCQPKVPCANEGCYSMKAWNCYPEVRRARRHNWDKLNTRRDDYFNDIHTRIVGTPRQKTHPVFFRWHCDGDIVDQDYLERMKDVAKAHPQVRMLAFTKNYKLNLDNLPKNLIIIPSAWPKYGMPNDLNRRFRVAYMYDRKNVDPRIEGNYFVCSGGCTNCWRCWYIDELGKDVVFPKH